MSLNQMWDLPIKGRRAISLAIFTARLTRLWCLAQTPVYRRGIIFPLSEIYLLSPLGFKYEIVISDFLQKIQYCFLRSSNIYTPRLSN